jgi:type IV pilus assembly protein PilE
MNTSLRLNRGITLIELMTVMLIVAILAAVAIPSYRAYGVRTNRAAARACLSEAAQYLERYYTTNMKYEDAVLALGCQSESRLNEKYTISMPASAQRTFTLTAVPKGSQAANDGACGTLSLDEKGTRGAGDNSEETVKNCWR